MSRKKKKKRTGNPAASTPVTEQLAYADEAKASINAMKFGAGIFLLLTAITASTVLVLENFGAMSLPGCGEGSGCARAAASVWGKLPGLNWPLSSVGASYFGALLITFLIERGRLPEVLLYLVRISVLGSVILVTVMIKNGYVCKYCLAIHAANMLFWLLIEFIPTMKPRAIRAMATLAGCFALALGSLVMFEGRERKVVQQEAEQARSESVQKILQASTSQTRDFTGRYHYGPPDAPMHIVMFTDYQCPDCQNIELQLERLIDERADISLSIKHFPFCTDCNPKINRNLHGDACNAARLVETAGILRGDEGFYEMHFWLFQNLTQNKVLNEFDVDSALRRMGYELAEFKTRMFQPDVEQRILADVEEASSYGLYFTPMIFINGQQLRGVATHNVLYRSIQELAASHPQPVFDAAPPSAKVKYIEDWKAKPIRQFATDTIQRTIGSSDAPARIMVLGDYLDPKTAELDRIIRDMMEGRTDFKYTFRHYPVNPKCNPYVSPTVNELSCRAHQAVAAAGWLGGDEAYWKMHRWIFDHQDEFSDARLREIAPDFGLDPVALLTAMDSADVQFALSEDMEAGSKLRLRGIPAAFVNGKHIPRLWLDEDCILDEILALVFEALGSR